MPEPDYNTSAVSSAPTSSPSPQSRPSGLGSRSGRNMDADMYAGSSYAPTSNAGTASATQTFSSSATSTGSFTGAASNKSDDGPGYGQSYNPAATLYSNTATALTNAGVNLTPPTQASYNPMNLYSSQSMTEISTEINDYLRGTAVDEAMREALDMPEVYQGAQSEEEPDPNITDPDVLRDALQPEPITVEELPDVIVEAGDTLTAIAEANNVPVQDVIDANPQIANPNMIRPGEKVKLTKRLDTKGETPARELPKAKNLSVEELEGPEALFSGSKQVLSSLTDTLAVGAEGNSVMNAQLRLAELGYDIGRGGKKGLTKNKLGKWSSLDNSELRGVDSDFGPATQRAVMAFQKDAGLPVTGDIDPTTAKALAEKEAVSYRVPAGFTDKYSEKQKTNFKAAEDAAISAGLKGAELAAYMAQVAHESDNFNTAEEYASGSAYEGRTDLGNTQPGDGKKFKGRGYIQLTGRSNYKKAGDALGIDLVNNPELAEEPENAAAISVWFWKNKVRPQVPDFMDTERVTKVVNGGFNGLTDRLKYFDKFTKQWSDAN